MSGNLAAIQRLKNTPHTPIRGQRVSKTGMLQSTVATEKRCLSERTNPKSAGARASTASDHGCQAEAGGRYWRADVLVVASA